MDTTFDIPMGTIEYQHVECDQHDPEGCERCDNGIITVVIDHDQFDDEDDFIEPDDPYLYMSEADLDYWAGKWEDRHYG